MRERGPNPGAAKYLGFRRLQPGRGFRLLRCPSRAFANIAARKRTAPPIMSPNGAEPHGMGVAKKGSGPCKSRKLKQPRAPTRHPQGRRRPAAIRRRSEMINQQSPSEREWPLRRLKRARLPLQHQQRLRSRSSECTSLGSLCRLDERSGNVCLSGAADRQVRS